MLGDWETWDAQAATLDDARMAVWGSAPWGEGVAMCLGPIVAVLDWVGEEGGRVLDLGCGIGRLLVPLADRWTAATLVGFDVSNEMLRHARTALGDRSNVALCHGSWQQLHLAGQLDAAYSVLTFQHLSRPDQQYYLDTLGRQMHRGAPLVVQFVPEGDEGPLNHPVPVATMADWVAEAGFEVVRIDTPEERPTWRWLHAERR